MFFGYSFLSTSDNVNNLRELLKLDLVRVGSKPMSSTSFLICMHCLSRSCLISFSAPTAASNSMKVFSLTLFCHSSLSSGLNSSKNATLFNLFFVYGFVDALHTNIQCHSISLTFWKYCHVHLLSYCSVALFGDAEHSTGKIFHIFVMKPKRFDLN